MAPKKRRSKSGVERRGNGAGEDGARGRAFWSGTLSFGLVSVPVSLFPAQRPSRGSLRMLAPDGTPLQRRWWCPEDEREVGWDELVRGYEMDDGSYVVLSDEELEAAAPEKSRDIDLRRFVPRDELDPVFFDRAYFLTPDGDSTKAYRLLVDAMEESGLAGIATFVMRTREYLVAILAEDGLLRGETLRWAGEVRAPADVGLKQPKKAKPAAVRPLEKAMDALAADELDQGELEDRQAERLEKLVAAKLKEGKDVRAAPEEEAPTDEADVIDLMEVLKRSLEGGGRAGPGRAGKRHAAKGKAAGSGGRASRNGGAPSATELAELSKGDLYERAKKLDIPGRSGMSKDELVAAIRKAG